MCFQLHFEKIQALEVLETFSNNNNSDIVDDDDDMLNDLTGNKGAKQEGFVEGMKNPFEGINKMIKGCQRMIKAIKSLSPRIAYLGMAMQQSKQGLISMNDGTKTAIVGGFDWFTRHVKWIMKGECFFYYLIEAIFNVLVTAICCIFIDLPTMGMNMVTGSAFNIYPYISDAKNQIADVLHDMGIDTPSFLLKIWKTCYTSDGCSSDKDIQYKLKYLAPAHYKNASIHFKRADCAFKEVVKPF